MTLDTSQRREGYASRSRPASDEMVTILVGAHEHHEAAMAEHQADRYRGLAVRVRSYTGLGLLH
ncbi:hypothetical protein [Pseudomonas quasicaspiana]|uniref:hypothetical protein n=1 Tax=Pseudomonas quasicaspiana TaxID=2829821 RepID=UPI001E325ADD|nr:hypothetical protein [Pseudomonas quasicaspiana]MCD5980224.1 hypothetical protein [Pseudomonas quasicaspiana]